MMKYNNELILGYIGLESRKCLLYHFNRLYKYVGKLVCNAGQVSTIKFKKST